MRELILILVWVLKSTAFAPSLNYVVFHLDSCLSLNERFLNLINKETLEVYFLQFRLFYYLSMSYIKFFLNVYHILLSTSTTICIQTCSYFIRIGCHVTEKNINPKGDHQDVVDVKHLPVIILPKHSLVQIWALVMKKKSMSITFIWWKNDSRNLICL